MDYRGPSSPEGGGEGREYVVGTKKRKEPKPSADFSWFALEVLAGGVATALSKTVVSPLNRVKLLAQVGMEKRGIGETIRSILRGEGVLGLFRGNGASVLRVGASSAVNYVAYDVYSHLLSSPFSLPPPSRREKSERKQRAPTQSELAHRSVSAMLAAVTSSGILYPLDVIRTRLAVDVFYSGGRRSYAGMADCLGQTLAKDGVRGLYRGFGVAVMGIGPLVGIWMGTFATLTHLTLPTEAANKWYYPIFQCSLSAVAMITAQSVVYPLDTIRRRLQVHNSPAISHLYISPVSHPKSFSSSPTITPTTTPRTPKPAPKSPLRGALYSLLHNSPPRATLYRGFLPNTLRALPQSMVHLFAYDILRNTCME